ncbi:probable (S)-N-methylcoclaurine 3'-hydroxylase isozyme 2 [Diospyros lotus]|uniref:probable (S)-N-methylcoclaurine 3'-hydroxylase isozyme 2 n=1 Tax=Diospyros lotus TaxID=55363 RepID=UPI002257E83E|nr:probable (S)-N-methylcoclaurine 3'-hydroxylase isozyme 2 [Diospyros lotus]
MKYSIVSLVAEAMPADLLFLLILLALPLVVFFIKRQSSRAVRPLPPGPHPWPIIGNLPHMGAKPHVALAQFAQQHGPLISLRLGTRLLVVASSPAAATEILRTHDRVLSGRQIPHAMYANNPSRNHVSLGWALECTDQWKFIRTLCRTELFSPKAIEKQSSIREKMVKGLVGFLSSKQGENVRIRGLVLATVFNVFGSVSFSKDEILSFEEAARGGGKDGLVRRFVDLLSKPNVSDLYPFLGGLDLQGLSRKIDEVAGQVFGIWEGVLRERRDGGGGGGASWTPADFLDVLLQNQFTDDQINYLLLELLMAGSDANTSTVEWGLAELIRNEEAMGKLRDELDRQIPTGETIRESHLHNLSYLQACVKETLRLHPPAPLLLPHRATQNCEVMGYTIPKGTQVHVNVWAIGRDPSIWEDPLVFKPERFLDNNHSSLDFKGNHFELLPFGGGRRICPGLPMGVRHVHLTLASLVYHFEWSLPHNKSPQELDMSEKFGISLEREQPLTLIPKRRR